MSSDTTEFWKQWKKMGEIIPNNNSLANVDGEKWEKYFSELYQENNPDEYPHPEPTDEHGNTQHDLNKPFTPKELNDTINQLKNKKAEGYDHIITEYIKNSPDNIKEILLNLFNIVLKTTILPKKWCLGIINPIHKEGPRKDPDNYRGICICSALMKLLCTMMNNRLTSFTSNNNLIAKEQIGFQTGNRTSDHILTIKSLVNKYVTDVKGGKLFACFIDLSKAFDTIWHNGLFHKLKSSGINGNFLTTLMDAYANT